MSGKRARVYSRIRENKLNPAESDITRTERQQAVIQALLSKLTSPGVLVKLPFIGDDVHEPADDGPLRRGAGPVRARQEAERKRSGAAGSAGLLRASATWSRTKKPVRTIAAFLGRSAPQPPLPGSAYGSGCRS